MLIQSLLWARRVVWISFWPSEPTTWVQIPPGPPPLPLGRSRVLGFKQPASDSGIQRSDRILQDVRKGNGSRYQGRDPIGGRTPIAHVAEPSERRRVATTHLHQPFHRGAQLRFHARATLPIERVHKKGSQDTEKDVRPWVGRSGGILHPG